MPGKGRDGNACHTRSQSPHARFRTRLRSVFLAVFDGFDLDRYRVHHIDYRFHFEFESRKDASVGLSVSTIM
jgi:hypothetical protein